jgi:hypothetical protein
VSQLMVAASLRRILPVGTQSHLGRLVRDVHGDVLLMESMNLVKHSRLYTINLTASLSQRRGLAMSLVSMAYYTRFCRTKTEEKDRALRF